MTIKEAVSIYVMRRLGMANIFSAKGVQSILYRKKELEEWKRAAMRDRTAKQRFENLNLLLLHVLFAYVYVEVKS
ncbi:hypothetical protein V6N13_106600 [Hibiscus sabdariffa]